MAKTRSPFWTSAFGHLSDSGRLRSKVLALETMLSSRTWQWSALTVLCLLAMTCKKNKNVSYPVKWPGRDWMSSTPQGYRIDKVYTLTVNWVIL